MKKVKSEKLKVKSLQGFTLIELLIVVAIIGILSALLFANYVGVKQRARDAQRKSNLLQLQSALELYRSDQGQYPPPNAQGTTSSLPSCTGGSFMAPNCSGATYMQKIPTDPVGTVYNGGNYYYTSNSGLTTYTLVACLENASDSQAVSGTGNNSSYVNSGCSSNYYYVLANP